MKPRWSLEFPIFLRSFLVRLAAVAGKGDALIFVQKHAVLGKNLPEDVVSLIGNLRWANKRDVIKVSKESDALPKISGNATLITKNLPKSRDGLRKTERKG